MNIEPIINSVLYSLLGVIVLVVTFFVIDKITPGSLWQELLERQNVAIGVIAAGFAIAVGLIIASAIR